MAAPPAEMLILDTDHMSELGRESAATREIELRLTAATVPIVTTIVTAEELLRGRLAQVARAKKRDHLTAGYDRLKRTIDALSEWEILPFDAPTADGYERLRKLRLGVATMDLRIAAIALANNATLLSRNLKDFTRVPELKAEDWLS